MLVQTPVQNTGVTATEVIPGHYKIEQKELLATKVLCCGPSLCRNDAVKHMLYTY